MLWPCPTMIWKPWYMRPSWLKASTRLPMRVGSEGWWVKKDQAIRGPTAFSQQGLRHLCKGSHLKPPGPTTPTASLLATVVEAGTIKEVTATLPTPTPVTKEVAATPMVILGISLRSALWRSQPHRALARLDLMTHKYRGSQQSSREVKPKFIESTQGEPKNIYKPW
jgi:hypothetical protein